MIIITVKYKNGKQENLFTDINGEISIPDVIRKSLIGKSPDVKDQLDHIFNKGEVRSINLFDNTKEGHWSKEESK